MPNDRGAIPALPRKGMNISNAGMFSLLFLLIFGTKLQGILDIPLIVSLLFFLSALYTNKLEVPRELLNYFFILAGLALYAGFISLIWGGQEIFFFAKFLRAAILLFLLYSVWRYIKKRVSYEQFVKYHVIIVVVHSLIIFAAILSSDFREFVYGITGYVPRGMEWGRSPGLTISFNATAIVHICALWFLISRNHWGWWQKYLYLSIILVSLVFLGRFVFVVGAVLIFLFYFFDKPVRAILYAMCLGALITLASIWVSNSNLSGDTLNSQLAFNFYHFTQPFVGHADSPERLENYASHVLSGHVYFSDKWYVLLFGNSMAGHLGLFDSHGDTDSDLGVINSINANGLIITLFLYLFYMVFIWQSRHGDWQSVSLVAILSVALSFKETGFFDSHATPLLFLLLFYQGVFTNRTAQ